MARIPGPRQEYTFEEQKKILDYIMAKQEFNFLRGNAFWQEMEQEKIVNRTWQSVKQHFGRKLIDKLHLFKLDPNDLKKLRDGWFKTSLAEKYENPLTIEIPNPKTYEILSSSDESVQEVVSITSAKPESDASSPDLLFERPQPDLGEVSGPGWKPSKTTTNSTVENQNENQISKSAESEQFSKKEDDHLMNFFIKNKCCWQNRKNIATSEFYKGLYKTLRSPEEIRNRFLNHILPNIDVQKLKESGVDLPKMVNQEQDKTAQPTTSDENIEASQMEIDEVPEESNMNVDNNVDIFDEHANLMSNLQIVLKLENPSPTQNQE